MLLPSQLILRSGIRQQKTSLWSSGSQPGFCGTLGCRKIVSGVPPVINFIDNQTFLASKGAVNFWCSWPRVLRTKKGWETLFWSILTMHIHCEHQTTKEEEDNYLHQCFPTFFGSWHLNLVLKVSGGTPSGFIRYKDQWVVIIGDTLGTSSRHPSVLRHPGWEPLISTYKELLLFF